MTAPPDHAPSALTADEAVRLGELVAEVLAAETPAHALQDAIKALEVEQKPALAASLYEALCYRVPVDEFWLQFRMSKVYQTLGPAREDAALFHAAAGLRMHPDWSGSVQLFRDLFVILRRRGRERDALDLFRYQMRFQPDQPAARPRELAPILARLEPDAAAPAAPTDAAAADACRLHRVIAEETRAPWTCPVFGGAVPYSLAPLAQPMPRPPITVAEFADAELLVYRNTAVAIDRAGNLHQDFSVGDFPAEIRARVAALAAADADSVERHEADDVAMIGDRFHAPNICHFLYDQMTRLAPLQQLGVDVGRALVIGPEPALPAYGEILRRAGVTAYLGTDRIARVRARRLWVCSNSRDLRHAAHYGAEWAVAFVQQILGGRGTKGWRRLYLSRADVKGRRVTNEADVVALLEPHGFDVIVPGQMAYDAQVAAFKQASDIIAPHGAALTHLVLCPPGAQVLEMFHPLYGSPAYALQARAAGLRYAALVGRDWDSDASHWNDPTVVDATSSKFVERHMRVDLESLSRYLATLA